MITRLGPGRFIEKLSTPIIGTKQATSQWRIEKDLASPLESLELLDRYRLVILGRDANAFLTERSLENLKSWVSKGGGCLMCARGAPSDQMTSKLSELLPVRWTPSAEARVHPEITQLGLDSSVFESFGAEEVESIADLPTLAIGAKPQPRLGLPQILMQSATAGNEQASPIVTFQTLGNGQSVVVEAAGMWRWAFLPPQQAGNDKVYSTLLQSLIQWIVSQQDLLPGQEVSIRPDRATFLAGERASCSVILKESFVSSDAAPESSLSVLLETTEEEVPKRFALIPSGFDPSLYRVEFGSLTVGNYSVKVVRGDEPKDLALSAFEVRDPWFESLEVDARPDLMRQIAKNSQGEVLSLAEVAALPSRFAERLRQNQRTEEIRTSLWDRPIVLLAILSVWIATWINRRQHELL
jgi:hypothetical protein